MSRIHPELTAVLSSYDEKGQNIVCCDIPEVIIHSAALLRAWAKNRASALSGIFASCGPTRDATSRRAIVTAVNYATFKILAEETPCWRPVALTPKPLVGEQIVGGVTRSSSGASVCLLGDSGSGGRSTNSLFLLRGSLLVGREVLLTIRLSDEVCKKLLMGKP